MSPEIIFQKFNLGELFVIRTAGHVLDNSSLESIQFAIDEFKCECIIVLGHENCGAVSAVYNSSDDKTNYQKIKDEICKNLIIMPHKKKSHNINASVKNHSIRTAENLLNQLHCAHPLSIHACYYSLTNGKVSYLCDH